MNLIRIDDRLIHGQVVVGWGNYLNPKYIIIVDDEISQDDFEKEIYLLGVPPNMKGFILSIKEAKLKLKNEIKDNYILLLKSLKTAYQFVESGIDVDKINIGGLHDASKKKFNRYIYVDQEDMYYLNKILNCNVGLYIQDLPTEKNYKIEELLSIKKL